MITVSTKLNQSSTAVISQPLYLVKIQGTETIHLSTRDNIIYGGVTWTSYSKVTVNGVRADGGTATVMITDPTLGAVSQFLGTKFKAAEVQIYQSDAALFSDSEYVPGSTDARLLFQGIIGAVSVEERTATVTLQLVQATSKVLFVSRRTIGPETGVNTLLAPGTTINIGRTTYILDRK